MRAISLWQPWASAIACGSKTFETRSWPAPKSCIGQEFAIHAAKRWTREEREAVDELRCFSFVDLVDLGFEGHEAPLGGFVAVGRLVAVHRTVDVEAKLNRVEWLLGNYEAGRYAWEFADVRPVEFLPFKGQQGIWTLDDVTVNSFKFIEPTPMRNGWVTVEEGKEYALYQNSARPVAWVEIGYICGFMVQCPNLVSGVWEKRFVDCDSSWTLAQAKARAEEVVQK